jgi:type IV pilus assembly protein PilW
MSAVRHHLTLRIRQRGLTVVELLIAMTVALLVLGTVALVFGDTSRNRASLERSARLIENVQYAMNVLRDDITQAGYYDVLTTAAITWHAADPCATAMSDLGWSVPGTSPPASPASIAHAPVPISGVRPADATPACIRDRLPGTAMLVVRYVGPAATARASASGAPYVQVSKCAADIANVQNLGVISSKPADFTVNNNDCASFADVKQYVVRTYYVASCDRCGVDTIPTLKRAELGGDAIVVTPVAEGIENLQIEYGIDANNDGTPDRYLDSIDATLGPAYGEWANVMAVRLYLLVRSTDVEPGYRDVTKQFNLGPAGYTAVAADGYKRTLLTSLVRPMGPRASGAAMTRLQSGERGTTLFVVMVLLLTMVWFALSAFRISTSSCRWSATRRRNSTQPPPRSGDRPHDQLQQVHRRPGGSGRDADRDRRRRRRKDDLTAHLTPQPKCIRVRAIKTVELDIAKAADRVCLQSSGSGGSLIEAKGAPVASGNSLCANSEWDIVAAVDDAASNTEVTIHQGVAIRVASADATISANDAMGSTR